MIRIALFVLVASITWTARLVAQSAPGPEYLYLWTASEDSTQPDFLAVLDVTEDSTRYGRLVTTLPVPGLGNGPHHTEHELAADRQLFANGFGSGRDLRLRSDRSRASAPRPAVRGPRGVQPPHSYIRLPDGNVLATFQMRHGAGGVATGGLVEVTPAGAPMRSRSAEVPGLDPENRVYSAGVVPALDRIVTTTTDMHGVDENASHQLQIWRLSDLAPLHTITLPDGPAGDESALTAEPRVLADGRTVLVSTFSCGLYLMEGLEGETPSARLVASFPRKPETYCAIPVIAGDYYLVTVPAWSAVVSLDISDPAAPREVSRLTLGSDDVPHWISVSADRRRVAITGYGAMQHRVLIARFDPQSGELTLDDRFREAGADEPGFRMDEQTWPHGGQAKGTPHGAVFSRP